MRIGLALGGGGLTGTAFHAGVLNALAEHLDPREAEVIVGTSAGSTAAALMRSGFPATDYVARVTGRPLSPEGEAVLEAIEGGLTRADEIARECGLEPLKVAIALAKLELYGYVRLAGPDRYLRTTLLPPPNDHDWPPAGGPSLQRFAIFS